MSIGTGSQDGDKESVWAKLLRRSADAARLAGALLQAVWYGTKIW
ncbi:hypothetical protein [Streptomyces torulosus]|nr:hypothetical protein [Streptomyces torulosus]